jgi:hypothetical protein
MTAPELFPLEQATSVYQNGSDTLQAKNYMVSVQDHVFIVAPESLCGSGLQNKRIPT